MRKLWVAVLCIPFILMLAGLSASAESTDSLAFSTDGVELSFVSAANSDYIYCPLTVLESGKVTISCLMNGVAGQFGVQESKEFLQYYPVLYQNTASPRSLYLHPGIYWVCVHTHGEKQVRLSAILDALPSDTEPNDTVANAQQFTLPGSVSGIIGRCQDSDIYKISVTERVGVSFSINTADGEFHSSLMLYNSSNAFVQDISQNPVVALEAGVYYLTMKRFTYPFTTAYTISASTFRCVDSLSVQPTEAILEIGETITLQPTALPQDNEERIAFTSSVPSVASVTGDGVVKALAAGTTTIKCTVPSGASAEAVVTVLKPTATNYKLPRTCKGTRGFMYSMYGWLNYPSANRAPGDLKWKSSNGSVASITAEGILTCNRLGKVKITATNSKGKKFTTTLTVVANQLTFSKPNIKKGYIGSYPKRLYYKGNYLYIEVFLYNHTKYNIRSDYSDGYIFELYDLAKSTSEPIVHQYVDWNPGRIKKGTYKVFKISLDRSRYDNYDLGLGQLYPLIYTNDDLYIVKHARIQLDEPTLRKIGIVPHRADNASDFM